MKKRVISLLLGASMAASAAQISLASTPQKNVNSAGVFLEDFEEFEVGVLYNTAGSYTVGNMSFTLAEGDIAEIAEESGNKYLKLTRGNNTESSTNFTYNFPENYSGAKYRVSYDLYADAASKHFSNLGSLFDKTKSGDQRIRINITYGSTIYCTNTTNWNYHLPSVGVISSYQNWTTHMQTIDLNGEGSAYTYDAYVNGNNISGTFSNTASANAISGITWSMIKHSAGYTWNGPDGNKEETQNTAGIYRFDNILVEKCVPADGTQKKIIEDFEGYPERMLTNAKGNIAGIASINANDGDSVGIAKDTKTGSKALKIVKGSKTAGNSAVVWNFGEYKNKITKLKYDVRFENHSRLLRNFPSTNAANWAFFKDSIYWKQVGSGLGAGNIQNSDSYYTVEQTLIPGEKVTSTITNPDGTVRTGSYETTSVSSGDVRFYVEYASQDNSLKAYVSHMGQSDGNGVYWIDNIEFEIVSLDLVSSNIKDGDTNVTYNKNFSFTFNQEIDETSAKSEVIIMRGAEVLAEGTDYNVTIAEDGKTIVASPTKNWGYNTNINVIIGEVCGKSNISPFEGTGYSITTGDFTSELLNDDFSGLELGQKWENTDTASREVQIGENIKVKLAPGDSVEYAHDAETGKDGLKLIKNRSGGTLDFKYIFPENYVGGKYRVEVDERIQNWSCAHPGWSRILANNGEEIGERGYVISGSLWTTWSGAFGTDRYGTDWSGVTNSRYIAPHSSGTVYTIVNEFTAGAGNRVGLKNADNTISWGKEPAIKADTLTGVLMRMQSGGTNWVGGYYAGSQVDEDTVNNPNNNGIAWIYGVRVLQEYLRVSAASFEKTMQSHDPSQKFTVTFDRAIDTSTVNPDTVKLYKNGELITSYEYGVAISEDEKTITVDPVEGLQYGTIYKIVVSQDIRAKEPQVSSMPEDKEYTIKTADYEDNVNPDIVWSTIFDGAKNIDPETQNIVLRSDAAIKASTINKNNIKLYENGVPTEAYTVSANGLFAINVNFNALNKGSQYKITVSGLLSDGDNSLEMRNDFVLNFSVRTDIYTDNEISSITADGTKSEITAELFNKAQADVNYQAIGVLKTADGKILSVNLGSSGIAAANDVCKISVSAEKNAEAATFELYVWDSLTGMKPLCGKKVFKAVNERTYGYDNYMDSAHSLNISYIGGSITQQGQYSTPLNSKLSEFLRSENAERKINYNVRGIGGTGSDLGLYRLEKDVISANPDLVFIEFAVNDAGSSGAATTMEGMIRKLMKLPHQPMIVLLDLTTKNHGSLAAIEKWEPLMEKYGIGYVNVAEYLIANEASDENPTGFVWTTEELKTYPNATALTGSDGTHPNADGGKVYADYIYNTISASPEKFFKKINYVQNPVTGKEYNNPRMISWKEAQFDNNWAVKGGMRWAFADDQAMALVGGATLTFKFTGTTIGLYWGKNNKATSGTYSIDNGTYTGNVSAMFSAVSSEMPMASIIKNDLPEGEHTITITANSAEDMNFKFGYFIVD